MSGRRGVAAMAIATAVLLCGCQTASPPADPSPTPVTTPIAVPRSDGVAVTEEQLTRADPCGLVDTRSLSAFGQVDVQPGFSFTQCRVTVAGTAEVQVRFTPELEPRQTPFNPVVRQGVTIYNADVPERDEFCVRAVVLSRSAAILVSSATRNSGVPPCSLADAAIDGMLLPLTQGRVPPLDAAAESLAFRDACTLVDAQQTAAVPGLDRTRLTRSFNGQFCTWGDNSITQPHVSISFSRFFPTPGEPITIGDRTAVRTTLRAVEARDRSYTTVPKCSIEFAHRPLDSPGRTITTELVELTVAANQPLDASCRTATELATTALARLEGR